MTQVLEYFRIVFWRLSDMLDWCIVFDVLISFVRKYMHLFAYA